VPPAPEGTLSYTYFPTGKVQTITSSNPNGASVAYTYDDLNRLSTVVDNSLPGNNTTSYTYDPGAPVDRSSSMGWRVAQVPIHKSGWPRSLAFGDLGYHYVSRSTPMTTTAISAHTACFPRSRYSNNYLYRGEQFDSDLGLYYLRARYYNPATGRFMSRDPLDGQTKDPASLHKYLYADGDPVNGIDPTGRGDLWEYAKITAYVVWTDYINTKLFYCSFLRFLAADFALESKFSGGDAAKILAAFAAGATTASIFVCAL